MNDNDEKTPPSVDKEATPAADPLADLEQLRLKAFSSHKILKASFIVIAVVLILCSAGVLVFPYAVALGFIVASIALIGILSFRASRAKGEFANRFKEEIVGVSITRLLPDARYTPNSGISKQTIADTGMMNMGNSFESEDLVEGTLSGVKFAQSDVTIIRSTHDSEGGTNDVTLFGGRWIVFDGFNKEFTGDVLVVGKGFGEAKEGSSIFTAQQNRRHKIELEDATFNAHFSVYTNDDHEVYYLLTPQVMQPLLKLDNALSARIILCFVANQVHVGLSGAADSFEPKLNVPMVQQVAKSPIAFDLLVVRAFMEALQIDHKIFNTEVPAEEKNEKESESQA